MAVHTARDAKAALEIKLTGSPGDLHNAFEGLTGGPETVRRLQSTYHDTANNDTARSCERVPTSEPRRPHGGTACASP